MSGGAWNRRCFEFLETAQELDGLFKLIAQIEHEMDYGICGDTCYDCAKIRVIRALELYFNRQAEEAIEIVKDRARNPCATCQARPRP
jgi:hypothetical protein